MNNEQSTQPKPYTITEHGSLGVLALGHIGIKLWKKAIQEAKEKRNNTQDNHAK